MIERILDKYYNKKLLKKLEWKFHLWCLDYKFKIKDDRVHIYIKRKKYKEEMYKEIENFNISYSLEMLLDFDKVSSTINKKIERYFDNENNKSNRFIK